MSNAAAETRPAPSAATSNQISWLALTLTPGLGPTRGKRLLEFFGSIEGVLNATLTELEAAGLPTQAAQSLGTGRSVELANDELAKAAAAGVQCVTLDDPAYPSRLRQIYDPPLVLYVRGNVAALSQPGIAVIGTRHPTPYGIGMAERLACDLATRSFWITLLLIPVAIAISQASAILMRPPEGVAYLVVDETGRYAPAIEQRIATDNEREVLGALASYAEK